MHESSYLELYAAGLTLPLMRPECLFHLTLFGVGGVQCGPSAFQNRLSIHTHGLTASASKEPVRFVPHDLLSTAFHSARMWL